MECTVQNIIIISACHDELLVTICFACIVLVIPSAAIKQEFVILRYTKFLKTMR